MSMMEYLRIFSDSEGCSHFETLKIPLESTNYAPPAPLLSTSSPEPAKSVVFLELPVGWHGDWHPTPVRQWLMLMTGECEYEAGDGKRCLRKAGDIVMLDDVMGEGHRTKVIGDGAMRIAAVHFV